MALLPATQNSRRALYRAGFILVIALLGALALASRAFSFPDHTPIHAAATVLAIVALTLAWLMFDAVDETAKQGQYIAWYWGGMLGLCVVAVSVIAFPGVSLAPVEASIIGWFAAVGVESAFQAGLLTSPALMLIGFTGWWTVYWLRRR